MTSDQFSTFRSTNGGLRVNLGCGNKVRPGFLGVDIGETTRADVKMDVLAWLSEQPEASVSEVYSRHMLEHLPPDIFRKLLEQINRILKPGGKILFIVPHYSNPYYYSDPTHRQPFGVHTFSYLCESTCLTRVVPKYASIPGWNLKKIRVGFVPYKKIRLLGIKIPMLSDFLNLLVNTSQLGIELFERYFASIFSIYEISYWIEKR